MDLDYDFIHRHRTKRSIDKAFGTNFAILFEKIKQRENMEMARLEPSQERKVAETM